MISWAALLALSGFEYSAVKESITFTSREGVYFWSNGYAWGQSQISKQDNKMVATISVRKGSLELKNINLKDFGKKEFVKPVHIDAGEEIQVIF